jgi:hypothetical protein
VGGARLDSARVTELGCRAVGGTRGRVTD